MNIKPNKVRFFASTYEELLKNASIVPRNKYICFSVFEAKSRMDSCVLSPNSAKPTTIKGINRSYAVIYVFDSDKLIGRERARLRKSGKTIGDLDLLIASTCLRYDLTVLTDNTMKQSLRGWSV